MAGPWQASANRLVGRTDELAHLRELVDGLRPAAGSAAHPSGRDGPDGQGRRGGLVLVGGEPGVGKSRLVR